MKKMLMFLMVLCFTSMSMAVTQPLFHDSFDREDALDLDASSDGMSGLLAPMTYVELDKQHYLTLNPGEDVIADTLSNIEGNALHLADGPNMGLLYLDHNFTDAAITDNGGMRVGISIISNDGTLASINHFCGFGIGNTLTECQNAWFDFNGVGFRGRVDNWAGTSDMWVGWTPNSGGTIQVYKNGPTSEGGENYDVATGIALTGNDRLELELVFADFNDGTTVDAKILWNGQVVGTDSFTWDADGVAENYIAINARQNNSGFTVDDLAIDFLNYRANNPSPDGSEAVLPTSVTLGWDKGKDASADPSADITQHYVYVTSELVDGDPNFAASGAMAFTVPDTTDPVTQPITVGYGMTYYWRVDESINDSGKTDPNTITGDIWQFDTLPATPVIDAEGQPEDVLRYPYTDEDYEGNAVFTCSFVSINTPSTVEWYRAGDPNNALVSAGDINIDTPAPVGNDYVSTLTIANVEEADEDAYYCKITVGALDPVVSDSADLGVRRLVGYWPLDGDYSDIIGGHTGDPNLAPDPSQWVTDVPDPLEPTNPNSALNFVPEPLAAADTGEWIPSAYTSQVTVSAWVKWAGPNESWQGIVSNRVTPGDGNFYVEIRNNNGNIQLNTPNANQLEGPNLPEGEWAHVAVSAGADGWVVYVNGLPEATRTPATAINQNTAPLYLGALQRNDGVLASPMNGIMDDIRVYNYAMTPTEVVDLYYEVWETATCINPDDVDLTLDIAGGPVDTEGKPTGDCKVNLIDFAEFAKGWLDCGLVPATECNN